LNDKELSLLRKLYSEIIQGYSVTFYKKDRILVKHFTALDQGLIDSEYEFYYNEAIREGLPNAEQRLESMIEQEVWSRKDEAWINSQRLFISNLVSTKSKTSWESQVQELNKNIEEAEEQLNKKLSEKQMALGLVAETYASRKLNESYIKHAFRQGDDIKKEVFTDEAFEDFSTGDLNELASIYNESLSPFQNKNLKKIGLASFFQSVYGICDDNPHVFYGKAVCELTYYQSEIFTYGRFFKSILSSEIKPDEDKLSDPDKLIDWYMSSKNAQKYVGEVDDDTNGATMVFNAKKSDIVSAGGKVAKSPVQVAIEKGKSLDISDVMKHHRI